TVLPMDAARQPLAGNDLFDRDKTHGRDFRTAAAAFLPPAALKRQRSASARPYVPSLPLSAARRQARGCPQTTGNAGTVYTHPLPVSGQGQLGLDGRAATGHDDRGETETVQRTRPQTRQGLPVTAGAVTFVLREAIL